MTSNEKDLLLQDICSRLPHGVVVATTDNDDTIPNYWMLDSYNRLTEDVRLTNCDVDADCLTDFCDVRPYLFPLSSITEEQYYEMMGCSSDDCLDHMKMIKSLRECTDFTHWPLYEHRVIDWFIKNNFDYRGLIPMGLAIDATGKNIY